MTLREYFDKGITYGEYMAAFEHAVASKRTSGPIQTEEMAHYTELNLARSKRIFKHTEIRAEVSEALDKLPKKINVICFTEFWCGDSSQVAPVVELMAQQTDKLEVKYLFRDENLELVDQYLTSGGRSIPKYILFDADTGLEIGTWGPRPADAQKLVMDLRSSEIPYEELKETVQRWYNADKTYSIQTEWMELLKNI